MIVGAAPTQQRGGGGGGLSGMGITGTAPATKSPTTGSMPVAQGGGLRGTASTRRAPASRPARQRTASVVQRTSSSSSVTSGASKARMKRSNSEPENLGVKLVDTAPLPPDTNLKFWQVALLYPGGQDGGDAKSNLSVEWFMLMEKKRRKGVLDRCAQFGISPDMAKQVINWECRAQATVRGVQTDGIDQDQLIGIVDTLKDKKINTQVTDREKEMIKEGQKKAIKKKEQCNPDMLKQDAIDKRGELKNHPAIIAAVDEMWEALPKCPKPYKHLIDRQVYTWMSLRILETIIPEAEREGVLPHVSEDWWSESRLEFFMDYDAFFEGIYTYVDVWCPEISAPKYVRRINNLTKIMTNGKYTFNYAVKLAERHWVEWLEKIGCNDEAAAFSPTNLEPPRGARKPSPLSPETYPFIADRRYGPELQRSAKPTTPTPQAGGRKRSLAGVAGANVQSMDTPPTPLGSDQSGSRSPRAERVTSISSDKPATPPPVAPMVSSDTMGSEVQLETQLLELAKTLDDIVDTNAAGADGSELAANQVSSKRDLVNHHKGTSPLPTEPASLSPQPPVEGVATKARPLPA